MTFYYFSILLFVLDDDLGQKIEDDPAKKKQKFRCKFLLFSENRRPAYRGTWRKKSTLISARRPFATDQVNNYSLYYGLWV